MQIRSRNQPQKRQRHSSGTSGAVRDCGHEMASGFSVTHLTVRVIPRSSKPGIAGIREGALLIRLQSPPVEGAANEELILVIAETFGAARRDVEIVAGERSRLKRVAIGSVDRPHVNAVLRSLGMNPDELARHVR